MKRFLKITGWILLLFLILLGLLFVSHGFLYGSYKGQRTHKLTVLTYNTWSMGNGVKANNNQVIKFLEQQDADVVCLQEMAVYKSDKYLTLNDVKRAMKKYPYSYFDFKNKSSRRLSGNAVFSKYPLLNQHTIQYQSKSNVSSSCDVVVDGDTIRLFNNHLESYKLKGSELDSVAAHPFQPDSAIRSKLQSANYSRFRQARVVSDSVAASPYPVILVGDLNSLPLSPTYMLFRLQLRDAFLESSSMRLGNTYKRGRLGLRIDYILHSKGLHATECVVVKTTGSDHLPLKATLVW
ncbi:MAG: endonuclease/exonuclease/phosphatase family protein [Paludibacteraceae bacterium]|nr:endonuclease/exonuclease/phosphatase family protein [Paludibacteraceae bacterium]